MCVVYSNSKQVCKKNTPQPNYKNTEATKQDNLKQ